jgi:hypothetical protein
MISNPTLATRRAAHLTPFALVICAFALALALITLSSGQDHTPVKLEELKPNVGSSSTLEQTSIFRKLKPILLQKTRVPLRLPSYVPEDGDKSHPIFAILQSAKDTDYEIELGWTEDCNGGNACHYGTIRGSTALLTEDEGNKVPVGLVGGIKGHFIDFTCGAHCDDSSVGWTEGGYHYSISLKAEKMATLIKVANTAILEGQHR